MAQQRRRSPAPTDVLGDDRRRLPVPGTAPRTPVVLLLLVVILATAGCIGAKPARTPVPAGPLGPIVAGAEASQPPIECRGLAAERCLSAGSIEGMIAGIEVGDAERVIVSCEGDPCTAAGGAMRIDLLLEDGTTVEVARGGYGEFRQP